MQKINHNEEKKKNVGFYLAENVKLNEHVTIVVVAKSKQASKKN